MLSMWTVPYNMLHFQALHTLVTVKSKLTRNADLWSCGHWRCYSSTLKTHQNLKVTSVPWARAGLGFQMTLKPLDFENQGKSNKHEGTGLQFNRELDRFRKESKIRES